MCSGCDHKDWLERIDFLLEDDAFGFAEDTLLGIQEWVNDNKHITEKQQIAIENIENIKEG